jgi:peptidoglycan hydrolase-like protein with peptidoglycan-binding domain
MINKFIKSASFLLAAYALLSITAYAQPVNAQNYVFTTTLRQGMRGQAVLELQKRLVSEWFLSDSPTGFFGQATVTALQNYQRAHSLDAVGFLGQLTRASLNGTTVAPAPVPVSAVVSQPSPQTPAHGGYDGVISQMYVDGSFVLRMRDGSKVLVKNPFSAGVFLNVKGIFDPLAGTIDKVTTFNVKDPGAADALPNITVIDPGSGQVGTKVTLTGTGFLKTKNSVIIGSVKNAVINVPSADGTTLTFTIPSAPCDQLLKVNCPTTVLPSGNYDVFVSNANGVSNNVAFTLSPLPPLTITTDILPQFVGGTQISATISAIGGAEAYVWRISGGQLPPGLMLAQGACTETPCKTPAIISGTPTVPGIYQFTTTIASGQENISKQFSITVIQPLSNSY